MRLALILVALIFIALAAATHERILERDIQTLTLHAGQWTTARRGNPYPQIECKGPHCGRAPPIVQCTNSGWDGHAVQWKCQAVLDADLHFGPLSISCEGWDRSGDAHVLVGSCALEYELGRREPPPARRVVYEQQQQQQPAQRVMYKVHPQAVTTERPMQIVGLIIVVWIVARLIAWSFSAPPVVAATAIVVDTPIGPALAPTVTPVVVEHDAYYDPHSVGPVLRARHGPAVVHHVHHEPALVLVPPMPMPAPVVHHVHHEPAAARADWVPLSSGATDSGWSSWLRAADPAPAPSVATGYGSSAPSRGDSSSSSSSSPARQSSGSGSGSGSESASSSTGYGSSKSSR
jgi:uncharacterized membrane protein YgcG